MQIGFIGLGTMGYHMAGHLASSANEVVVYNRTQAKAEQWVAEFKGRSSTSIAELAAQCDLILSCVGNDDDVHEVYFSESGILANAKSGSILVDHTTTSATLAKKIFAAAKQQGNAFLDAPVSGGEAGAINGQLATMIGGEAEVVAEVLPALNSYSKAVTHMGAAGNGQLCKMANQVAVAGVLQGLSEAVILAESTGLDISLVKEAISGGAAGSWQLSNRMDTMHAREFDFGFAIDWMRKDLAFCLDEAKQHDLSLTCAKSVDAIYAKQQAEGKGRSDTSILIKQFDV